MSGHKWIPSTLGHGDLMCEHCRMTSAEARVLGEFDKPCSRAPAPADKATPVAEVAELVARLDDCLGGLDNATAGAISDARDLLARLASDKAAAEATARAQFDRAEDNQDRAERAEAERDEARAECVVLGERFTEADYSRSQFQKSLEQAEADLSSLKQRAAEVLEPFAKWLTDFIPQGTADDYEVRGDLFVRDLRRAAELHASLTGKEAASGE